VWDCVACMGSYLDLAVRNCDGVNLSPRVAPEAYSTLAQYVLAPIKICRLD
jgi:hypothetical protein